MFIFTLSCSRHKLLMHVFTLRWKCNRAFVVGVCLLVFMSHEQHRVASCFSCSLANIYLLHPQTRTESPTQSEVHLYDHIHTAGNWVPTETQQWGILHTLQHTTQLHISHCHDLFFPVMTICLDSLLGSWHFSAHCLVNFTGIPLSLLFSPVSGSTPPPFPLLFLTSVLALPKPPSPPQNLCLPPTLLIPLPPCRSVNTSGWASMMTGHQSFQISENHRK